MDRDTPITGLKGVGEKTAMSLIQLYHTIAHLYDHMPDICSAPNVDAKPGLVKKLAEGKDTREFDGRLCVMELGLRANVALIRAHKADTYGNLVYAKTARNFNAVMATAADYVVAEVDEIVEPGQLDPDLVVTPHLFVDAVIQATKVYTAEGVKDRDER